MKVRRICERCGKEFYVVPSVVKRGRGKFCSKECANLAFKSGKKVRCGQCGKMFYVKGYKLENNDNFFCSRECYREWQNEHRGKNNSQYKEKIKKNCDYCGKELFIHESHVMDCNFCCNACMGKWRAEHWVGKNNPHWQGVECVCGTCGKTFFVGPARLNDGRGKFCSKECFNKWYRGENRPNWKGGISFEPYCEKFNEAFKERIRDKFDRKCFICNNAEDDNGKKLAIHHVDYDKTCLCNTSNSCQFVPLCASCHSKTNGNREYWQELIMAKLRSRIDGYGI